MSGPGPLKTYTIVRQKTGLFFICIACGHKISVDDFPKARVPKRTMAAAAMRTHQQEHAKFSIERRY